LIRDFKNTIQFWTTITMAMGWLFLFVGKLASQNPLLGNQGFQIITEGNFTSNGSHHIHGPLAVGGNLVISNGSIGEVNMDPVGTYILPGDGAVTTGLLVGGSITWTSGEIRILNNKYVHIGNSTGSASGDNGTNSATQVYPLGASYNNAKKITTTIDQTPSPAVFQSNPLDFTTLFDTYRNNSFGLSNCTANVQLYNNSNVALSGNTVSSSQGVKITSLINGVNHLKLTTTSLTNISEFKFEGTGIPSATKILVISVNLTGNYTWNNCNMPGISGSNGAYIIWNFYGSTTYNLTLSNASLLIGTLFAPAMNFIKTGTGDIDGNIVAKTATLGTGEVHYYPFNSDVPNCCVNNTNPGAIAGNQSGACGFDPSATTSSSSASGGSGTQEYGWEYSTDGGTTWINITGATSTTYNPAAIYVTTNYRRKARRRGCDTWVYSNVITKTVTSSATANAGADISQCYSSAFTLSGNTPASSSYAWSVVSGTVKNYNTWNDSEVTVSIASGTSATLRYTVTSGSCIATDDVVISNTTDCTPICEDQININGDLEQEGTATNFNLTFNSTPALLIQKNVTPLNWFERYGGSTTSTTAFNGAFYIKKTGAASEPHSGTHMIFMKGSGICLSALATNAYLSCGKTYKFSVWVAAFTNSTTQTDSPFALEHSAGNGSTTFAPSIHLVAPASSSWNDLNWQRYDFIFTVPGNGYSWGDFYFTSLDSNTGIVIDDVCISEIYSGSSALAGADQFGCSNVFRMEAITPPAGFTGTWSVASGTATISSPNSPTSQVTITSGSTAALNWTVSDGSGCSSSDKVSIGYTTGSGISVNNASICSGQSATLTATGCTSSLNWSTGATTSSITVSPTSTTTYRVTCTPPQTSNLVLNGGFESSTNFQNWSNWGNSAITTTASEVRSGSKAAKVNATSAWGGFGQEIAVTPGQFFTLSFWAKGVNLSNPEVGVTFFNTSWTEITTSTTVDVTSNVYTKYTITVLAPPTAAWMQFFASSDQEGILLIDDVEVTRSTSCQSIGSATVTVSDASISMASPVVSSCIDHPIQDVATVNVAVSWSNAPSGDKIKVTLDNKIEIIDVAAGATSPSTVTFMVPADGTLSKTITATWLNTSGCSTSRTFNAPNPCSTNPLNCDILYLCGLDKPADGDAWDHGFINYLESVNSGSVTAILVKPDASGMGTYNPNSPSSAVSVDFSIYKTIIVSPTTQGSMSTDMVSTLKGFPGGVLNMNYDVIDDLGQINRCRSCLLDLWSIYR
jgi:choice-of-anchor A domain-containing protein